MLRVAVDATPLLGRRTGVGVVTAGALRGLAGRDELDLRAFAMSWRGRHDMGAALPAGVRLVRWPLAAAPLHWLWRLVDGPVIEWWTGPVDVVHGTNFVVPPAARAAEVVTVHDLTSIRFPELCQPATLRYPALIRRAIRRGAWVHAVSEAVAAEVVELLGAPADRLRVVPPGVGGPDMGGPGMGAAGRGGPGASDQGRPGAAGRGRPGVAGRGGPGAAVGPIGPWSGRPYVLSLGRAEPRKDLPLLVRAFDEVAGELPDVVLVLAGPPGWAEDALTGAVEGARHHTRIFRLGWVSDDEKAALLAGAAVFAYPSVYEGFGIPPLEAMAAGVPVVATAAGGVPEAVGPAAELVPVGDLVALSAALARLLGDPEARGRLVAAGHQRVELFTWGRCADGLHALYQDAAASRSGPTRGRH